jgi:molybdopterin converting factor small subunit
MTEDKEHGGQTSSDAWKEVGDQFAAFGENLAAAFRSAWENEGNQQALQDMKEGLQSMAASVAQAVDDAVASPEGQKFRKDAEDAAKSAYQVGTQTVDEVTPHVISALQQVGDSLKQMFDRLGQKDGSTVSDTGETD